MSMGSSFRSGRKHKLKAEINVVPFIDVMLVLLIIFMITAPLIQQGVKVDLPETKKTQKLDQSKTVPIIITVDADGKYYLNIVQGTALDVATIVDMIKTRKAQKPDTLVLLRGDKAAAYGFVVQLFVTLKQAGVDDVGLMTDSPKAEKR